MPIRPEKSSAPRPASGRPILPAEATAGNGIPCLITNTSRTSDARSCLRTVVLPWAALWLGLLVTGCSPIVHQRSVAFVEPPRERLQASLTTDRIKVRDTLQLKLADGSAASLNGVYEVHADGSVEIRGYGKVQVAGKTIEEARNAVREALAAAHAAHQAIEVERSEYYLVTVTANGVQDLTRVPLGGRVTVKEAVRGIPRVQQKVMWIVRPTPRAGNPREEQILPIDAEGLLHGSDTSTNFPLQAGDWLIVADEPVSGFGRLFGAVTSMFSGRKSDDKPLAPRPAKPAKPASDPQVRLDQVADPRAERI